MIPEWLIVAIGFVMIIISLIGMGKYSYIDKRIIIRITKKDQYIQVTGFPKKDREKIEGLCAYDVMNLHKKLVDYENQKREEETHKTKEGYTTGNSATS